MRLRHPSRLHQAHAQHTNSSACGIQISCAAPLLANCRPKCHLSASGAPTECCTVIKMMRTRCGYSDRRAHSDQHAYRKCCTLLASRWRHGARATDRCTDAASRALPLPCPHGIVHERRPHLASRPLPPSASPCEIDSHLRHFKSRRRRFTNDAMRLTANDSARHRRRPTSAAATSRSVPVRVVAARRARRVSRQEKDSATIMNERSFCLSLRPRVNPRPAHVDPTV